MDKALLLIDDGHDHLRVLDNIANHLLRNESINLTTKYIDPNNRKYLDEEQDPSIQKLIEGIKEKLDSIKPDLIVVDQFYSGNNDYKGLDVIEELRKINKFKKCEFFLISGKRNAIVRDIFAAPGDTDETKVKRLAKIIDLKITSFLDKNFKDEAIGLLKKRNLNEILPSKLRNYEGENKSIHRFSPKYSKLKFEELADMIEGDSIEVSEILDEMFDLTLSHYSNINEKLQ